MWGLDLRLPHDSVIWEDSANLDHATGRLEKTSNELARIVIVGYKHEGLFFRNHGYFQDNPGMLRPFFYSNNVL
jgi:uncharacterized protein involved in propanediol utilization